MQAQDLDRSALRRLAETRPSGGGLVVSAFLSLDPSEFATPPARATAVRSLLDEAHRRAQERDGLSHAEREALKVDLGRVEKVLEGDLPTKGAHAVAVFASSGADLLEVLRLPRSVGSDVVIDHAPFVEPLAALHGSERQWAVLLSNRRTARLFTGGAARLVEVEQVRDEVRGQHAQGGTEQARRQRSIDHEVDQHLRNAAEALRRRGRRRSFDRLLVGAPSELVGRLEDALDAPLRERLAGRVEVDVEHATADTVLAAAEPLLEADDERCEREALDRLKAGVGGGGRGVAGLADTLEALSEQRVEILLKDDGFSADGARCPSCGWLGVEPGACPADGTPLVHRDDVVEDAVERALAQSAEILVVRRFDDLRPLGGVGAVLRF
ncbi:MAG: host attachment protein [Actinomycetota bacterium]|nr:host attachment protein [Actinomycetota bacterium]MDQ3721225.1 host attachment protein [Actinomycetota bacterium]